MANAHRGSVTSVYVDANYILSGGQDGAVRVWARSNRKLLIQFNGKYISESSHDLYFLSYRSKERYRFFVPRHEQASSHPLLFIG